VAATGVEAFCLVSVKVVVVSVLAFIVSEKVASTFEAVDFARYLRGRLRQEGCVSMSY
jgi:hypothetical protein